MGEELKRAWRAPQSWVSFVVCVITLMGYSATYWIGSILAGEWLEYRESALHLSLGGIFFGGFMLLLPFCSALAHSTSQVDDVRSRMIQWEALRGSVQKYACIKAGTCMSAAAVTTASAFILHAIFWNLIALPNNPTVYQNHVIYFIEDSFFYTWYTLCYGLPVYIEMALGIAFTASVWAMVALAIAVWIPDKILTVVIPSFIYYLWNADVTYWLIGIHSLHPAALFNDGLNAERMIVSIISYSVIWLVSWSVYYVGCKRRCRHA